MIKISNQTLIDVLSKMLGDNIISAGYQAERLHGGTLGDVELVTGVATSINGKELPYKVISKKQKKWDKSRKRTRNDYRRRTSGCTQLA